MNKKRLKKKVNIYFEYIFKNNTRKKMLPEINNIYIFVPVLNYQRKK